MNYTMSRFAVEEDVFSESFSIINNRLFEINKQFCLVDHTELNRQRFHWANSITQQPSFYASRMWEYPFAILAAELKPGMKCADIGCGTTPFTPYLSEIVGAKNVTGFDPDYFENENQNSHYAFGIRKDFIEKVGFNFFPNDITRLNVPDESFDRVFCISVIEHIEEPSVWQNGIKEMVRVLKSGGRLIITVDLGINCPLTNPLDIIKYSGLIPSGSIDLHWTEKRFVNLNGNGMDVFGMILEKSNKNIFADYKCEKTIVEYEANNKFIPDTISKSQIQIGKDITRKYGKLIALIKLVLGKYK